jgi:hypothetical protein
VRCASDRPVDDNPSLVERCPCVWATVVQCVDAACCLDQEDVDLYVRDAHDHSAVLIEFGHGTDIPAEVVINNLRLGWLADLGPLMWRATQ